MSSPPPDPDILQQAIEREFACARCGHCCKGDGLVHVGVAEVDRAAAHLGLTRLGFLRKYARREGPQRWVLKDKWVESRGRNTRHALTPTRELWCIFLEIMPDGLYGCAINAAKPDQCASFPARWRNPDSLRTCVGLRVLTAKLRESKQPI